MHVSVRAGLRLSGSAIAVIAAWNASIAQEPSHTTTARTGDGRAAAGCTETTAPETTAGPQTNMPQITVTAPKETPRAAPRRAATTAPTRVAAAPAAPRGSSLR